MENNALIERFCAGAERLGLPLDEETALASLRFQELLLKWNARVNLTAIVDPAEAVEKHLLDSLAALPLVAGRGSLLDLGAGAGLPSIPLALALPKLRTVSVDAVMKKVGFIKQAIVGLGLGQRCQAVHLRAVGQPTLEGLEPADCVVSRALMDLPGWLRLARPYVRPGGCAIGMLGKSTAPELRSAAEDAGARLEEVVSFELPFSGSMRSIARFCWT